MTEFVHLPKIHSSIICLFVLSKLSYCQVWFSLCVQRPKQCNKVHNKCTVMKTFKRILIVLNNVTQVQIEKFE